MDVRDRRRFDPYAAALEGTFAETEMRRRSRIVQVSAPRMRGFRGAGARITVWVFAITPAVYGEPEVRTS